MKSAFIHITNACNLKCLHCAYGSGKRYTEEIGLADIRELISKIKSNGGDRVMIGGGEPLIHPDLPEMLDLFNKNRIRVKLETNLTIKQDIIDTLPKYEGLTITTSIDSMNPKQHDSFRGQAGAFAKTTNNIRFLRKEGIRVTVNSMMLKWNYKELTDFIKFAEESGVIFRPLFRLINTGRVLSKKISDSSLTAHEIQEVLLKLYAYARLSVENKERIMFYLPPALIPPDLIQSPYICDWGNFIGVSADGTVCACPAAADIEEFVLRKKDNLGQLDLNNIQLTKFTSRLDESALKGVCGICLIRHACGGGCRVDAYLTDAEFGSPDPLCEEFYNCNLFPLYAVDPKKIDNAS